MPAEAEDKHREIRHVFMLITYRVGSISAVSRVRSLILPEERRLDA